MYSASNTVSAIEICNGITFDFYPGMPHMHAGIYKSTEPTICMTKRDKPLHHLAKHAAHKESYRTLFSFMKRHLYYFGKICFMKKQLSFLRMTYM